MHAIVKWVFCGMGSDLMSFGVAKNWKNCKISNFARSLLLWYTCTFHGNPLTVSTNIDDLSFHQHSAICHSLSIYWKLSQTFRCALTQPPEVTEFGSGCAFVKDSHYCSPIFGPHRHLSKHIWRPIQTRFAINTSISGRALQCRKHSSAENYCTRVHRIKKTSFFVE